MSILGRLFGRGDGGKKDETTSRDEHAIYYYMRCGKCGEPVCIRIDRRWDLEQEFEDAGDAVSGYAANKEVMGKKCFQMMHLRIRFDRGFREVDKSLRGGTFITRQEFE